MASLEEQEPLRARVSQLTAGDSSVPERPDGSEFFKNLRQLCLETKERDPRVKSKYFAILESKIVEWEDEEDHQRNVDAQYCQLLSAVKGFTTPAAPSDTKDDHFTTDGDLYGASRAAQLRKPRAAQLPKPRAAQLRKPRAAQLPKPRAAQLPKPRAVQLPKPRAVHEHRSSHSEAHEPTTSPPKKLVRPQGTISDTLVKLLTYYNVKLVEGYDQMSLEQKVQYGMELLTRFTEAFEGQSSTCPYLLLGYLCIHPKCSFFYKERCTEILRGCSENPCTKSHVKLMCHCTRTDSTRANYAKHEASFHHWMRGGKDFPEQYQDAIRLAYLENSLEGFSLSL
ncbi:hypothetical protein NHQ30_004214 [Ciborinia camelliae]|nr:hypothetical protein NHQ30_004214 [Ciborinia camelliae]